MNGSSPSVLSRDARPPNSEVPAGSSRRFAATTLARKKVRMEKIARTIFLLMALAMIVPLLLIVGYLCYQAWPILSWDFLVSNPQHGMRAGGIWSPLLGTIYLVVISLMIAAPIGVLAAVYLNE
jgi:phosphate transport system permease protein